MDLPDRHRTGCPATIVVDLLLVQFMRIDPRRT